MYFKLKYVEGAVPGGKRKAGAVTGGDVQDLDDDVDVQSDDEAVEENELDIDTELLNVLFEKDIENHEFCEDFMGEEATWNSLSFFSRDE